MKKWRLPAALALLAAVGPAYAQVDVDAYIGKDKFEDIKLSPTGEYYAATIPLEDRTGLVVVRRGSKDIAGTFSLGRNAHVNDFHWVNDERLLISSAEKLGLLDEPVPTGELYAINANGGRGELLVGYKKDDRVAAFLVDPLNGDDRNVIVSAWPFTRQEPYTSAQKLDIYSGRRWVVARAPVQNAEFTTDNAHEVRFAQGAGIDRVSMLYYRSGRSSEWRLVNDERISGRIETPLGFSEDNRIAYLRVQNQDGPDSIVAWDVGRDQRKEVLRDSVADPLKIIYRDATSIPVGAIVMAGKPKSVFFDEASPEARMYHSLEAAFGGEAIYITSSTKDGRLVLVQTYSDSNPGDFYVFDTVAKKAEHLISRRNWFDPGKMASVQPISLKARDGLNLHGYMTLPRGAVAKHLPMVVMPHGGPYDVFDTWSFDTEAQMLAQAGYAVLQINFRGSGNYGRAFTHAGGRQWGGTMQDDVTDATRWAIQQGYADPGRICIYGASYGGYAALMGVAKEPSLYRCAAGYVGVYDLPMMFTTGDIQERGSGETYLKEWIGDRTKLAEVSPVNLADRIKVPVFLAAGGEDKRAPIQHSKRMEASLRKAGVPVETLYYDTEGHGFYTDAHQREYYTKLLAFLANSLGGQRAMVKPSQP
ncbi:alpha/beta hydrolase family protein [[Pseudomonas] boreopolis]|uniref:alpha/beta hydrolase family protein n=1 Tax=Xanthomonas boreopolis TaxID=86183 RepID=UPI003DA117EC